MANVSNHAQQEPLLIQANVKSVILLVPPAQDQVLTNVLLVQPHSYFKVLYVLPLAVQEDSKILVQTLVIYVILNAIPALMLKLVTLAHQTKSSKQVNVLILAL
jgi:hypothetical protein